MVTVFSGILGVYVSFFIDSAPAPTIILILTIIFIGAFIRSNLQRRQVA
jgi:manganese/iron transport system permease protein